MSTWKKASKVNQKTHKERHQPQTRAHLGLLQKKKDYIKRAREYHEKQNVIKKLKKQALNRNPDEYYFHMVNSRRIDGKHVEIKKPDSEDTLEQKLLMENKNLNYVNMKRVIENKKIEKMQSVLHVVDLASAVKRNHVFYDSDGNLVGEPERIEEEPIDDSSILKLNPNAIARSAVEKKKQYKMLSKRIERHNQLAVIQRKMEMAKEFKKSNNKPKLVKHGSKTEAPVYVWKYERKR